jgi:DNA gyrase subunit B
MPQIIDRNYLYIAQPPLFRVKKGKSINYLKNEAALDAYLIDGGARMLQIRAADGRILEGDTIRNVANKLEAYYGELGRLVRRGDPEVVDAMLQAGQLDAEAITDPAKMLAAAEAAKASLLRRHGPEARIRFDAPAPEPGTEDADIPLYHVAFYTWHKGAERRTDVHPAMVRHSAFTQLRQHLQALDILGPAPYAVLRGEDETPVGDAETLLAEIKAAGRKGIDIQRYKGLGEMNPEQLWDTTMNPDTRTLLQVRVEDSLGADEIFDKLMGDEVEPRRKFIEDNALNVKNLDI